MTDDPEISVRVRMYRQGLGDCHLITVLDRAKPVFRMLIDCGVYQTVSGGADKMRRIVADVIEETGGEVDVLVVTHEHWDHVSGFVQARALFATHDDQNPAGKLRVGAVWMGWTEDPQDKVARQIVQQRGAAIKSLAAAEKAAIGLMETGNVSATSLAAGLTGVLGFFGGTGRTTADALTFARSLVAKPRYCRPSDAPVDVAPGVRSYVLGPPLDPAKLFKLADDEETYTMAPSRAQTALFNAIGGPSADADEVESSQPFEASKRRPSPFLDKPSAAVEAEARHDFFAASYWGADDDGLDQSWRRIDGDWLTGTRQLALKLDNATNNTSVVVAFEIEATGKTLVFAADAQVGSWLSWLDLKWGADATEVTGPDLLERAVFLKVGHHGSHNATLRGKGLETMGGDLIAFVPTDEDVAKKVGWGRMPLPSLITALDRHTGGRVARSDKPYVPPANANDAAKAFESALKQTELYFEIDIP